MDKKEIIELGFKEIKSYTVMSSLIYDLGRNRQLSIGSIGTPNELMFITEISSDSPKEVTEAICVHNYDYDGYITKSKLSKIIEALSETKEMTQTLDESEINTDIMNYISKIEIKKEPEWANTIKNNLVMFYSWLLEKKYLKAQPKVSVTNEESIEQKHPEEIKYKGVWTPVYMAERIAGNEKNIMNVAKSLESWAKDILEVNQPPSPKVSVTNEELLNRTKEESELSKFTKGFISGFESDYVLEGVIVDNPSNLLIVNYEAAKKALKASELSKEDDAVKFAEWTPVSIPPLEDGDYLVTFIAPTNYKEVIEMSFYVDDNQWAKNNPQTWERPTHWMKKPLPPQHL